VNRSHDGLSTGMHMDMFHRDLLLALAAVAVERIEQRSIGAGELVRLAKILLSALECLLAKHGAPVAFHCGVVGGEELGRHHALDFVFRPDASERRHSCAVLTIARVFIGMLEPERLNGLVGKNVVPMIGLRSADILQPPFQIVGIVGDHRRWFGFLRSLLSRHRCVLGWSIPIAASAAIASALRAVRTAGTQSCFLGWVERGSFPPVYLT